MVKANKIESYIMGAAALAVLVTAQLPVLVQAQVLEEIVVTAQRREQSLQEVPISIESISGDEIRDQNFRNMEDLSAFSPSVYVSSGVQDQEVTVRGFGTIGNSLTLEQAVPIFLDGIHYGRQSQIKTAFLDVDRVEVLKGPQPVYFGQNASAGAFNIISKGPTPEWEGVLDTEYGNNGTKELSFGIGGPISDTLGIRVAGAHEESDGYLKNAITGEKLPRYNYFGGRVTLQWNPTDNLQATTKFEYSRLRNGSEAVLGCTTRGSLIYGRRGPDSAPNSLNQGNERSVWVDPPRGVGLNRLVEEPISDECFKGNVAFSNEGPYLLAPDTIYEENSSDGSVNATRAADVATSIKGGGFGYSEGVAGADSFGLKGQDYLNAWTGMLNLQYTFDNDIEAAWTTAHNNYWRNNVKDNSFSPFFINFQGREENFRQWSSELRFTSPAGGAIEWMAGVSWQETAKDNWSNSLRPNVRRAQRFNWLWEDVTWQGAFATLTFNFLDDRAAIDVGGRYSHIEKDVFVTGYGATWIFDVEPVSAGGDAIMVDPADARLYIDGADLTNLWTIPYKETRNTPDEWYPSTGVEAVGLTAPDFTSRLADETDAGVALSDHFTDSFFDPQITLRYRAGENHSLFFRWAQASKGAGYDTGQTSLPADIDEMKFEAEQGETFELGSKGNFWDGRARYDVALFRTEFTDLQLSGLAPITDQDSTSVSLNAGKQRVQGIEFSVVANVTERLRLGLNGAIMDGEMVDFAGSGCNEEEFYNTDLDLGIAGLNTCDVDNGEITDRSGDQAPRTPDWKFVVTSTYNQPILDNYEITFNAKGYYSDGYITARDSFSKVVMYNKHGDMNLSLGFGDRDGVWKVSGYANNIFEARQSYNGQFDALPDGIAATEVPRSSFLTYGLKFGYNFR